MSKETAKKLIAEMQTSEELKAKIAGITDKDELVKMAVEAGYDVTLEELTQAEHEYRAEQAAKTDELTADELEAAAGGKLWQGEENPEGKEYGCAACNLKYDDQKKSGDWCRSSYYCESEYFADLPAENRRNRPHH